MITEDQFNNWWSDPVAIEFKKMVKENLDKLAYGNMTQSYCRDQIGNAIEVGKYEANKFFYNLRFEDI